MALVEILGVGRIVGYLVVVNVLAFGAMGFDKWKAVRGAWRIPEQTLMALVLLGGGFGGIAGMYVFRHKTKKVRFYLGFPVMLVLEIVVFVWLIVNY